MACDYRFEDVDGDVIRVKGSGGTARAWVQTLADGVYVPAAEIPAFCRAVYESAGLEAPELPEIVDPVMVQKLADALEAVACGTGFRSSERHAVALKLVADGWECK